MKHSKHTPVQEDVSLLKPHSKGGGGGKRERERNTFALGSWNGVKGRGERGEREDPLKGRRLQEEEREEKKKLAFKKKKHTQRMHYTV